MEYKQSQLDSPYNDVDVFYCKHCLSLKIRSAEEQDYCDKCGSTDIEQTSIFNWLEIYQEKYNENLIK